MDWLSERPQNGLLTDAAIIALIIPGSILTFILMLGSSVPWYAFLLIIFIDLCICGLFVLMALYLNRYMRYRISEVGIEVRGVFGCLRYTKSELKEVVGSSIKVNALAGLKMGLGGFSGMLHGRYTDQSLGWVQVHGLSQARQVVILRRYNNMPVVLSPQRLDDFLSHLLVFDYPVLQRCSK